jgi:hypothetical protein
VYASDWALDTRSKALISDGVTGTAPEGGLEDVGLEGLANESPGFESFRTSFKLSSISPASRSLALALVLECRLMNAGVHPGASRSAGLLFPCATLSPSEYSASTSLLLPFPLLLLLSLCEPASVAPLKDAWEDVRFAQGRGISVSESEEIEDESLE